MDNNLKYLFHKVGILGKSLNRLSQNLRIALTDLKKANAELEADIEREKALEQTRLDFFLKKRTAHPDGSLFEAEKEGFEPSRRY